jgi:hypothetical protein
MNPLHCSLEDAVAKASVTGIWPEELAAHAGECAVCREVAETARWIQALAASPENAAGAKAGNFAAEFGRPLPDPDLIWKRAQLDRENHRRTPPALEWARTALAAAAPIGLAGWVAWNWYAIEGAAGQFLVATWPQLSMVTYVLASVAPAALLLAALSLGYPLLAEE